MRAPLAFAGLTLIAASLPIQATSTVALEGETCLGKPATVVDIDGGMVTGTDGDDVIVVGPDVTVFAGAGRDAVCVIGTDDANYADVQGGEDLAITLGGGYDTLHLSYGGAGGGLIDSGDDGAYLELVPDRSARLDLARDSLSMDGDSSYVITGAWDVTASAKRVSLIGDSAPNNLRALNQGCFISIEGGRGKDWLAVTDKTIEVPDISCGRAGSPELRGQRGSDLLVGYTRNDRLFGGRGLDTAKAGFGTDTCRAEVEKSCER